MNEDRPVWGLVLAGGKSSRMGRDKALLYNDGTSQLEKTFELVASMTPRTFVSTRRAQSDDPERSRYPRIVDRYDGIGPVAGILSAMDEEPGVDWLVVACDLPNLDRETLETLLRQGTTAPFAAYRSTYDGLPEPLCAVYRSGSDAIIRKFVGEGLICPRKMLIRSDTELLEQPRPDALDNVNTPDDLAASVLCAD